MIIESLTKVNLTMTHHPIISKSGVAKNIDNVQNIGKI